MIVAVSVVLVMEMSVDKVVDVISMWDRFVPATRTVNMVGRVPSALMTGGALIRIDGVDVKDMLLHHS